MRLLTQSYPARATSGSENSDPRRFSPNTSCRFCKHRCQQQAGDEASWARGASRMQGWCCKAGVGERCRRLALTAGARPGRAAHPRRCSRAHQHRYVPAMRGTGQSLAWHLTSVRSCWFLSWAAGALPSIPNTAAAGAQQRCCAVQVDCSAQFQGRGWGPGPSTVLSSRPAACDSTIQTKRSWLLQPAQVNRLDGN